MSKTGLKFLLDVGVGRKAEEWLISQGYDVKSIRTINPSMADETILNIAVMEKRMVITMDKDFGEMIYHSGLAHVGVLLLRLDEAPGEEKAQIIAQIMHGFEDKMLNRFCVYKNGRLRIRP